VNHAASRGAVASAYLLPFAFLMTERKWILPADPVAPVALMSLVINAIPIVAIPVAGSAFNQGNGETVLIVLAATVAVGLLLNLSPPRRQIDPPGARTGRSEERLALASVGRDHVDDLLAREQVEGVETLA
jgi:hypothetical protein